MTFKTLVLSCIVAAAVSCNSEASSGDIQPTAEAKVNQVTTIHWIDSARDFGKITEGQKLAVSFRFKNTGNKPLVIESVQPACGCTVADYPKQPIAPGEEGEITGEFNSEGRAGQQHKEITVTTNTPARTQNVVFDVNVVAKPKQAGN